jgi:glycosyltransferase involved in cell wall biosynthesis
VTVLLLPVHTPGHHLSDLVAACGVPVVVVDDGSGPSASPVLQEAESLGATVLRHAVNQGKGAALKTGFRHIAGNLPDLDVVCADGDGQHRLSDIRRVADHVTSSRRMTLGVRSFDGEVPFRSRLGNRVTSQLFRAATGRFLGDTQTGLRGHPADQLEWLCSIEGARFEYEMNVLLAAARAGVPVDEVTVATVYNGSSKFSPLSDSARIYWPLLRSLLPQTPPGEVSGSRSK